MGDADVGFPIHAARNELAAALNHTIAGMVADGSFDEIYDEFFDTDSFKLDR